MKINIDYNRFDLTEYIKRVCDHEFTRSSWQHDENEKKKTKHVENSLL